MGRKYKCGWCGWIYDPSRGDPSHGVAPGTPFEELPDDWRCPACNAPKEEFILLDMEGVKGL
ncbi:MAG TPA: rubredoxin [Candidatus Sumerlaeota bacterium]|jgi:rubredoxin|nr:MAG: High molecular weight rubredoxin [candidate division BRC1 bacterium ADurb.Bin183]HOE63157.1 rubredoxin [Candidatus Sumerlaeota bacterium]HRR31631.1 rubredoxin [Candidatus Sumerlaeia bacterium]HON51530.1 rubredoxin [Candidatus Sumerlaeota bacterium]HOR65256.1 rubredoxin [Candidatus Sumerlaeota bacterium]